MKKTHIAYTIFQLGGDEFHAREKDGLLVDAIASSPVPRDDG
jgi:hypothetical protein